MKGETGTFDFYLIDISISMNEKIWQIVEENSFAKRESLFKEYEDLQTIERLYRKHQEEGAEEFSWRLCMDKGWLCFQDLGHFKNIIIESGVTEEEWKKYIWEHWNDWAKEKIEKLLEEYDEYRKDHLGKDKQS